MNAVIPICLSVKKEDMVYARVCMQMAREHCADIRWVVFVEAKQNEAEEWEWFLQSVRQELGVDIRFRDSGLPLLCELPGELRQYGRVLVTNGRVFIFDGLCKFYDMDLQGRIFGMGRRPLTKKEANYCRVRLGRRETECLDPAFCLVDMKRYQRARISERYRARLEQEQGLRFPFADVWNLEFGAESLTCEQVRMFLPRLEQSPWRLDWYSAEFERDFQNRESGCWTFADMEPEDVVSSRYGNLFLTYVKKTQAYQPLKAWLQARNTGIEDMDKFLALMEEKNTELKACQDQLDAASEKLKFWEETFGKQAEEYKRMEFELSEIRKSVSYRLGLALTSIPRKIRGER